MKAANNHSRVQLLVNDFLNALLPHEKPESGSTTETELPGEKSQRQEQLIDHDTQERVDHLTDIISGGFKLNSLSPISPNKDYRFRLGLTREVVNKPYMVFAARSRWCQVDPLDPLCYNVGFQLVDIAPSDLETFKRMIEKYGSEKQDA